MVSNSIHLELWATFCLTYPTLIFLAKKHPLYALICNVSEREGFFWPMIFLRSMLLLEVSEVLIQNNVFFQQFFILSFQIISISMHTLVVFVLNLTTRNLFFLVRTGSFGEWSFFSENILTVGGVKMTSIRYVWGGKFTPRLNSLRFHLRFGSFFAFGVVKSQLSISLMKIKFDLHVCYDWKN